MAAAKDRAAFAGWVVAPRHVLHIEAPLGVVGGVGLLQPQPAFRHKAKTPPFEAFTQFEYIGHLRLSLAVALARDGARVLVFYLVPPVTAWVTVEPNP